MNPAELVSVLGDIPMPDWLPAFTVSVALITAGVIIYTIRLEGRVSLQDHAIIALRDLATARLDDLRERLMRIETYLHKVHIDKP